MTEQAGTSIPSPATTAVVLAVSPLPADRLRLREILSPRNWELHETSDCGEALAFLRGQSVPALLCERDHADGSWEDLLGATARLPAPPNLIVFSRLADESLWAEVLNMGGFDVLIMPFEPEEVLRVDVLITPFEPEEVLRVTFAAWSRWEYDFAAAPPKKQMRRAAQLHLADDVVTSPCRTDGGLSVRGNGATRFDGTAGLLKG